MIDETDVRTVAQQLKPSRRAVCARGHMLWVNRAGDVVMQLDRGMWVETRMPQPMCPRCGAEVER
jgi:hypothetical protein